VFSKRVLVMVYDHRSILQRMNEGTSVRKESIRPKGLWLKERKRLEGGMKGINIWGGCGYGMVSQKFPLSSGQAAGQCSACHQGHWWGG